jgi:hypothetical protein
MSLKPLDSGIRRNDLNKSHPYCLFHTSKRLLTGIS